MNKPEVVFQPTVQYGLKAGINMMVNAIRPTLGPHPRKTLIQRISGMPEMLDNGGVIARRIIQIENRNADMGAMLTRQMLWQLHENVGDGTATAAVIFQKIYNEGLHFLVNGGDKMLLRHYLEEGLQLILAEIDDQTQVLEGQEQLTQLAQTICYDLELAKLLGEIFDILGEYGQLEIRDGQGRAHEREYIEGIYWKGGLISRLFLPENGPRALEFENPAILLTDFDIEDAEGFINTIQAVQQRGANRLVVIARKLSESVIGYLYQVNNGSADFKIAVVKTPFVRADQQKMALTDMAFLTGGQFLTVESGQTLDAVRPEHLGQARRARLDMDNLSIIGGKGDARLLRRHIASLQAVHAKIQDAEERRHMLERIGRLLGGSAVLYLGGLTEYDIADSKERAVRTGAALRSALVSGYVPGGGVAYMACQARLKDAVGENDPLEKRAAFRILARALEEPTRTILTNAGLEIEDWLGPIRQAKRGIGLDVRTGTLGDMAAAGIIDSAAVAKAGCQSAISTAALALTVDVLIHRSNPPQSNEP